VIELVDGGLTSALVGVCGVRRRVELGLLEDDIAKVGDWVLIHVGFAMSKISEEDAID
jgi:hydrogenase expression/formation protein HypC